MDTLLNYEVEVMKTRLKCEGNEENTALADSSPAAGVSNKELKAWEATFNNSKVVRLSGHLPSDLWHQEKLIPPGVNLDVHLVTARLAFFIKTAAPAAGGTPVQYNYHIMSARFHIQFKELVMRYW